MAESAACQYEDQFICSVCLGRLKEPVTIPCGHSYCMSCITDCWGRKEQEPPYRCPQCRESFSQRPLLKKNTLIAEMMETLQKTSLQTAAVECDVCTTEKSRAVKSCLQCLASFCQTHLQPHYQSPVFMKHKLVEASRSIQENICLRHEKPLDIYCQDDGQCVCYLCMIDNHNGHRVVSVDSEWTSKKLTELRKRQTEIEKLLITDDQVNFLKSCQSACVLPTFEDVPSFTQHTHLSFKDISISAFREVLEDVCQQQTARISQDVSSLGSPEPKSPKDFSQYFCDIRLDPNTAHKCLILTENGRKASFSYEVQRSYDHPEQFDSFPNVLCREGLYGRCYWEVECSGNDWSVAVSYRGIGRKGQSNDCRLGFNNKSWRLTHCRQDFYVRHDDKQVHLFPFHSSRIGVYLDHRAGTLSFYSVSDTMTLLYTFQTTFTEPLYPAFGIGERFIRIIGHS
ncbi:tripartite motif-containing protein 16-like [Sinocyclocheilus grahami]|uniref:tripartite motif-containing protein 16-like n=1 Tax=Sinocyclocheilus grahami TaxID=75366 RepID=UPI0007AD1D8E|nr:PREDICTED: tripartite motif-containing protein 16-like [Sinocyclocheilus grahami]